MNLSTVTQLDKWMTENCYNDNYAIGNRNIHEGYGLEAFGTSYVWYYTERGQRTNVKHFETEEQAVQFAFETISSDKFANRHMVGFLSSKSLETELLKELARRNIHYWTDQIPYGGLHDPRYRVFVFGCDIRLTVDLKERFYRLDK